MNNIHKVACAAGIAAVLAALAGPANAADPVIPEGASGTLTIHKFEQPTDYGTPAAGMELPSSATQELAPLEDVQFQVRQIGEIDLTTHAGWRAAERATTKFDPKNPVQSLETAGFEVLGARGSKTDNSGIATFTDLPAGLYLVQETGTPPAGTGRAVTPTMPFLVSVPLTDPQDRHRWVYDVHVYPKNVVSTITKEIKDSEALAAGDMVRYKVSATIPGGAATTKFNIIDRFDSRLSYKSAEVSIAGKRTTDFKVTQSDNVVTISLGASARAEAFASLRSNAQSTVDVTFVAQVLKAGEISNSAELVFARDGEWETAVDSAEVQTKFGGIRIKKTTSAGRPLAGATFEVRAATTSDFTAARKVSISGKDSWATGSDGTVTIDGLRYSAWADGTAAAKDSGKHIFYWLVETQAPDGYELLADPVSFLVSQQTSAAPSMEIVNTPHNSGARLPETGMSGSITAASAGFLLLAGSAAVVTARRRHTGLSRH